MYETADPVSCRERQEAFVEACREIYGQLPAEQRALLDSFPVDQVVKDGHVLEVVNLTAPMYHGPWGPKQGVVARQQREQISEGRPDLSARWKPLEDLGPSSELFAKHNIRPVRERVVNASEIPDLFIKGGVAKFDATELLPRALINMSVADMAALHAGQLEEIPIYHQFGGRLGHGLWDDLGQFAERQARLLRDFWPQDMPWKDPAAMAQSDRSAEKWWMPLVDKVLHPLLKMKALDVVSGIEADLAQGTVNVKRLPKLPEFDMKKAMGSPSWIDRLWSMFWIGPVDSYWHFDELDNLVIAVHGTMYISVFEQQDTDVISGVRGEHLGTFDVKHLFNEHWLAGNSWVRKFPFIHMKLEPGMGVVIPSRTYHSIMAPDPRRVLLNAFIVPHFGSRRDPATSHSWHRDGSQADAHLALRHLRYAAATHLWESRKLGGIFSGSKNEFL